MDRRLYPNENVAPVGGGTAVTPPTGDYRLKLPLHNYAVQIMQQCMFCLLHCSAVAHCTGMWRLQHPAGSFLLEIMSCQICQVLGASIACRQHCRVSYPSLQSLKLMWH